MAWGMAAKAVWLIIGGWFLQFRWGQAFTPAPGYQSSRSVAGGFARMAVFLGAVPGKARISVLLRVSLVWFLCSAMILVTKQGAWLSTSAWDLASLGKDALLTGVLLLASLATTHLCLRSLHVGPARWPLVVGANGMLAALWILAGDVVLGRQLQVASAVGIGILELLTLLAWGVALSRIRSVHLAFFVRWVVALVLSRVLVLSQVGQRAVEPIGLIIHIAEGLAYGLVATWAIISVGGRSTDEEPARTPT